MKLGEKIKKLRTEQGITQTELAAKINTTKQNLYKYENGIITNVPADKIELIAQALNTTPQYLMGWSNEISPKLPSNIIPLDDIKFVKVPVIGRVAAGSGCLADNEIIGYEYAEEDSVKGGEYRYLLVKGDSMYPKFEEGDYVLVRCQSTVDSGSFAIVIIDDMDGVIKKVKYGKNRLELHSVNPMYPVRRFENEEILRVRIFGLVKEIKRKL